MKLPENFSRGDIPDPAFRQAFGLAIDKKSRFTIIRSLINSGISRHIAELHAVQFIDEATKYRKRLKRPHIIIGWLVLLGGVTLTVITLFSGGYIIFPFGAILGGAYWIFHNRD